MAVLVADTSVLIDLERGGLLETAFALDYQLVVPDLLYQRELAQENGQLLFALGLKVIELTSAEMEFAQRIHHAYPALSVPDCTVMSCARRPAYKLITGDQTLRRRAEEHMIDCGGLLWLLDQMEQSGKITAVSLAEGLARITAHPRCRLPQTEVAGRLSRWGSG